MLEQVSVLFFPNIIGYLPSMRLSAQKKKIVQAERSKFHYVLARQTVIYSQKVSTCILVLFLNAKLHQDKHHIKVLQMSQFYF